MRNISKAIPLIVILLSIPSISFCETLYRDFLTGFSDISQYENAEHFILIENQLDEKIFETQKFNLNDQNFTYQIRLKTEIATRKSKLLDYDNNMQYGIIWNYTSPNNYCALQISQKADWQYDDILAKRYLLVEIFEISNGKRIDTLTKKMLNNISYDNEYNSIQIKHNNQTTIISIGNKELHPILTTDKLKFKGNNRIGYYVSPKSRLKIKRIQFESSPYKSSIGKTDYKKDELDSIFSSSSDPIEGYYCYLDRNMNEGKCKLGGKYRIAIIKECKQYNMVYISGAQMLPKLWSTFMLKGKLFETPFKNHFNIEWISAEKETIMDESYADYNNGILTLNFPKYEMQVRFYKER